MKKFWIGSAPTHCDIDNAVITNVFIDGATTMGPWANMCEKCHAKYGRGLGTGKGQKYQKNKDGKFEKIAG